MTSNGPRAIVIMGVAASGKTTVGRGLAKRLGWRFLDADDFHSKTSREKMHTGRPLTDRDRHPWLKRLHAALAESVESKRPVVLACSALTERYRRILIGTLPGIGLVYLRITPELAQRRISSRKHFFNPALLANQFETLEEPKDAIAIDASWPIEDAVAAITESMPQPR
jgi:gluconokinase